MRVPTLPRSQPDVLPSSLRRRRRWYRRVLLALLVVFQVLVSLGVWQVFGTLRNEPGTYYNQHHNAIWIEHAWAGETQSKARYDQLAQLLTREQIRDVYIHVGPLASDGTIPATRYTNAARFVQVMKQRLPQVRLYAWIGQIEKSGGGILDLQSTSVRAHIAATARYFTQELGFDGVHYDIEPIHDGDMNFLSLLDATRQAIGPDKAIAVSTPKWLPVGPLMPLVQRLLQPEAAWWTSGYYTQVSERVDELAVMLYGTHTATPAAYQFIVKEETAAILSAAASAPHPAHVLIGIPTFHDNGGGFSDMAENMVSGLNGVTAGLNASPANVARVFGGVAIYPLWLTTAQDWQHYDQLWLGQ